MIRGLGGIAVHSLLVPLFVLCWVPPFTASVLLIQDGQWSAQLGQMAIAIVCGQLSSPGDMLGRSGTLSAFSITAALAYIGSSRSALLGSTIWFVMTLLNWGHRFQYSPAWSRMIFSLDMASYYSEAALRSQTGTSALDEMRTSRTIYCFHPHGIVTCGFSANGVWSREFNERTTPKPLPPRWEAERWPGTTFFIAASLREPSHLFKLLCDISGRLESASRAQMKRVLASGRNCAIIPGGFEEATLYEHGKHRVAIRRRKGLVKYALQHGYALVPIYTFGEHKSFNTFAGLKSLRLWLNRFQARAPLELDTSGCRAAAHA